MWIISEPNTSWENKEECPSNDLGYLLTDLNEILCDENWNRLLFHNWEQECKTDQERNNIL